MDDDPEINAIKEKLFALKKMKEMKKQNQAASQKEETNEKTYTDEDILSELSSAPKNETEQTQTTTLTQNAGQTSDTTTPSAPPDTSKTKEPSYSVFVGNLSPKTKKEQLDENFSCCGAIKRSTIVSHHYTHLSKGYAYIEFEDKEGMENALKLNNTLFLGNTIEVKPKRENTIRKPFRRRTSRRFRRS
ncbi:hypothetical protein M9Y10_032680 [Tritrichomonas musculus]|uniref:RRM domain-containing protein n=1 Tax=Tritrichomonas musculus TaxID=1915356 RepID=A0ABR2GXI6_9EUKA